MRDVVILGSTGSIGTQALDVVARHRDELRVRALSAYGSRLDLLLSQVERFSPEALAVSDPAAALEMEKLLKDRGLSTRVVGGESSLALIAGEWSGAVVLNGVNGGLGLDATLAALRCGARLALANKESLVVGGALVKQAQRYPGQVVPVDSEHSAIAQALASGVHERGMCAERVTGRTQVHEIMLTASGGPFRGRTRAQLRDVTVEQALAHPTWNMGPVVTINSSTLVNKGLELIEASLLFDVDPRSIVPVVHPQSIVHSGVTWRDGATVLQASLPDMRLPIALGLTWPERLGDVATPCDFLSASSWTFEPVDDKTFPAIVLARYAVASSDTHPAVFNAANEAMVDAFLAGRTSYLSIVDTVERVLTEHEGISSPSLDDVAEVQKWAKRRAGEWMAKEC